MDDGRVTPLTLLDLPVAFDTIDRAILLRWLDDWFGVTGKALDWFKSYLTGRCQRIKLGDCLFATADFPFGALQGSVLGRLLFTLYTTPQSSIISGHTIPRLTSIARCMCPSHRVTLRYGSRNDLQSCLASVPYWMLMNKLKLNPDKTEFLLIGNKQQAQRISLYVSYWDFESQNQPMAGKICSESWSNLWQKIHLSLTYIWGLQLVISKILSWFQDLFTNLHDSTWKTTCLSSFHMLAISFPSKSLRSNKGTPLLVPSVKTNTGERAFHSRASSLWHNLPLSAISTVTFRNRIEKHLFDLAFPA